MHEQHGAVDRMPGGWIVRRSAAVSMPRKLGIPIVEGLSEGNSQASSRRRVVDEHQYRFGRRGTGPKFPADLSAGSARLVAIPGRTRAAGDAGPRAAHRPKQTHSEARGVAHARTQAGNVPGVPTASRFEKSGKNRREHVRGLEQGGNELELLANFVDCAASPGDRAKNRSVERLVVRTLSTVAERERPSAATGA